MDPAQYTYPSPLAGWEGKPLPTGFNADGKSLIAPSTPSSNSPSYRGFPSPIAKGFDVHIYYNTASPSQTLFAQQLHSRIRLEFPELRIYVLWDRPIGPHTMAMFEVNILTPVEFGAFVGWLVINRGPLSALVHPNTGNPLRDHTQRATWMGERVIVDTTLFYEMSKGKDVREQASAEARNDEEAEDAAAKTEWE